MSIKGIVPASVDPITNGHTFVIKKACELFDTVDVVIAVNRDKKYFISNPTERVSLVTEVLRDELSQDQFSKIKVVSLGDELLVQYAKSIGASHVLRGIRNGLDFQYEYGMQHINAQIAPEVTTLYVSPPPEMASISSSMVKSLVGYDGWEDLISKYVNPLVIKCLAMHHARQK